MATTINNNPRSSDDEITVSGLTIGLLIAVVIVLLFVAFALFSGSNQAGESPFPYSFVPKIEMHV